MNCAKAITKAQSAGVVFRSLNASSSTPESGAERTARRLSGKAFTLIEMLVVLGIIGIIAAVGLGPLQNLTKAKDMSVAQRQLRDVLGYARHVALNSRSTVYLVFVPPAVSDPTITNRYLSPSFTNDYAVVNRLVAKQGQGYALYLKRTIGAQPGSEDPAYLTDWKSLPNRIFIHSNEFFNPLIFGVDNIHFPLINSTNQGNPPTLNTNILTPFIAFNSRGQLVTQQDAFIPLSEGGLLYGTNGVGGFAHSLPIVTEPPPPGELQILPGIRYHVRYNTRGIVYNGSTIPAGSSFVGVSGVTSWTAAPGTGTPYVQQFEGVRVNWLTGRSEIIRPEIIVP